jgi:hypothetical protein
MNLDALKQVWQEPPVSQEAAGISREELVAMIQARTAGIRQRTMQRVRSESYNYLILVLIPVVVISVDPGSTFRTVLAVLGILATVGPILGVLAYKEYRLRTLPPAGSLRDSLAALVAAIDSTSRFYLATYMICVVAGVALLEGLLVRRYGPTWIPAGALVAGAAFVLWAFRSGRAYAYRMFRHDRAELTSCLGELEHT